uniref:Uncharacterized protein n=1 Tax=Anguilla anguilla TaxID=7936 RepID=A0A0E9W1P1_ANGAN
MITARLRWSFSMPDWALYPEQSKQRVITARLRWSLTMPDWALYYLV